jgi:hypothetical protein
MAESEITTKHRPSRTGNGVQAESALQTEIHFWQDMIASCKETLPPEAIERMQQARALAERRLRQSREMQEIPTDKVFSLELARRKSR